MAEESHRSAHPRCFLHRSPSCWTPCLCPPSLTCLLSPLMPSVEVGARLGSWQLPHPTQPWLSDSTHMAHSQGVWRPQAAQPSLHRCGCWRGNARLALLIEENKRKSKELYGENINSPCSKMLFWCHFLRNRHSGQSAGTGVGVRCCHGVVPQDAASHIGVPASSPGHSLPHPASCDAHPGSGPCRPCGRPGAGSLLWDRRGLTPTSQMSTLDCGVLDQPMGQRALRYCLPLTILGLD